MSFCFDEAGRVHEGAMMADVLMVLTDMIECDGWRVPIRSYCIKIKKKYCKLHSGPGGFSRSTDHGLLSLRIRACIH